MEGKFRLRKKFFNKVKTQTCFYLTNKMKNESDKVKTRIRLVIGRLYRDEPRISFGWDWPTLCIVKPWVAAELKGLFEDLRALKSAGL